MRASDTSVVEALSRIAETFGKLVVQHVQLLRSEVEAEARSLAEKGRQATGAIARAAPLIIAGLMVASLGLAMLVGLLLEPWLGRAATPVALILFGTVEAVAAGRWLMRRLPMSRSQPAPTRSESEPREVESPVEPPQPIVPPGLTAPTARPPSGPSSSAKPSSKPEKTEEHLYGAVGRA